jgi:hypothetical protein
MGFLLGYGLGSVLIPYSYNLHHGMDFMCGRNIPQIDCCDWFDSLVLLQPGGRALLPRRDGKSCWLALERGRRPGATA